MSERIRQIGRRAPDEVPTSGITGPGDVDRLDTSVLDVVLDR